MAAYFILTVFNFTPSSSCCLFHFLIRWWLSASEIVPMTETLLLGKHATATSISVNLIKHTDILVFSLFLGSYLESAGNTNCPDQSFARCIALAFSQFCLIGFRLQDCLLTYYKFTILLHVVSCKLSRAISLVICDSAFERCMRRLWKNLVCIIVV